MNIGELLSQSSRVALAALLHDLGKFHERSGLPLPGDRAGLETLYRYSHAAHTGGAWDEVTKFAPDLLKGDVAPFASRSQGEDITDSLVNAAAAHHHPDTFLQWIVATADRAASGFERQKFDKYNADAEGETFTRKNRYQARMVTLFEQLATDTAPAGKSAHAYPLKALSPGSLFPQLRQQVEPADDQTAQAQYAALWQQFLQALDAIPKSHRNNWPLWLDHFDSAWLAFTHAIPSATNRDVVPDVSLYDHSKAVAALAVALWRWHLDQSKTGDADRAMLADPDRPDWDDKKFLLIQGDFFGIQDFIFANGGATQKHAHKLLRGRSFQVALLAELAALKLLDALQLPSTSQIINAAGKFLIVAPNTGSAQAALARCRSEFDAWCLKHAFGEIGVGIASTEASCNDLVEGKFKELIERLFRALDDAKHRRFNLCGDTPAVLKTGFPLGVCEYHGRYPADREKEGKKLASCALSRDQIKIGEQLTKRARLLVLRDAATFADALELDYFGLRVVFVAEQDISGKYGEQASSGNLLRAWDFDLPDADGATFRGYARRYVNTYVPRWNDDDRALKTHGKYDRLSQDEIGECGSDEIKTLHVLAAEDGTPPCPRHSGLDPESSVSIDLDSRLCGNDEAIWRGEIALVTLKGDIDNLGALFQSGLGKPTFARWAALSRQVNTFFALWLPWYCEHGAEGRYRNTYTVFAGGDDFFLIGPWEATIELASAMRREFARYVARDDITFSLGAAMTHPKTPARHLAEAAEHGLELAKKHKDGKGKNAAHLWGVTVGWKDWEELTGSRREKLGDLVKDQSTGFLYGLLLLSDQTESKRPQDALWRSRLHYRCTRLVEDKTQRQRLIAEVGDALSIHRGGYRLPVSMLLYRQRK